MLKTVAVSANRKTGPIAVTYRSGEHETYGTCPTSCKLHPKSETGTMLVDAEYLAAVADAVPRGGMAWTYSHFAAEALPAPAPWFPAPGSATASIRPAASCRSQRSETRSLPEPR